MPMLRYALRTKTSLYGKKWAVSLTEQNTAQPDKILMKDTRRDFRFLLYITHLFFANQKNMLTDKYLADIIYDISTDNQETAHNV